MPDYWLMPIHEPCAPAFISDVCPTLTRRVGRGGAGDTAALGTAGETTALGTAGDTVVLGTAGDADAAGTAGDAPGKVADAPGTAGAAPLGVPEEPALAGAPVASPSPDVCPSRVALEETTELDGIMGVSGALVNGCCDGVVSAITEAVALSRSEAESSAAAGVGGTLPCSRHRNTSADHSYPVSYTHLTLPTNREV